MTMGVAPLMPTAPRWHLDSGRVPAVMATQAMGSCARVRPGPPTRMRVGLEGLVLVI
jgi:hypothetical protein